MPSKNKITLSTKVDPKVMQRLNDRLQGTGVSRAQFLDIAINMILNNADMYEEIDFPVNEKRQVYVGDKLIMEMGGASEPGQFLFGLSNLTKGRGER